MEARRPQDGRARGRRAWLLAAGVAGLAVVAVVLALGPDRLAPPAAPAPASELVTAPVPVRSSEHEPGARAALRDAGAVAGHAPADRAADGVPAPPGSRSSPASRSAPGPGARPDAGARAGQQPDAPHDRIRHARPTGEPSGTGTPPGTAAAPGTVKISVTPWARVTVAGSSASCAETPCVLELPAGKHTLRLVNPVAGLAKDRVIELAPGETLVVRETLSP